MKTLLLLLALCTTLPAAPLHAERRALVIGNRVYATTGRFPTLATTVNDANEMHRLLQAAGFRVATLVSDAPRLEMEDRLQAFCATLQPGDEAVVYFAGHGVQYENKVYLMGTNAEFRIKSKLNEESVSQETIVAMLGERTPRIAVLILDCCREVPDQSWLASENLKRGLRGDAPPALAPPPNILIGFATSSGRSTNDSLQKGDANGPLVNALKAHWNDGLEWDSLWKTVATDVYKASLSATQAGAAGEIQMPSKYGQTIYDFYFTPPRQIKPSTATPEPRPYIAKLEPPRPVVPGFPQATTNSPGVPTNSIAKKKELLFSDDFQETELGRVWHSAVPTFVLENGALKGTQTRDKDIPAANGRPEVKAHAAVQSLAAPTKDSVVEVRIRFAGNTMMDVEFDDRNFTGSHYGHLCRAQVHLDGVTIMDEREGSQSNALIELKRDPIKNRNEIDRLYATHSVTFPTRLEAGKWYTLVVETVGDAMRVTIDGKPTAFFRSPGIGHATKSQIELGVIGKSGFFDDLKIWNAEPANP